MIKNLFVFATILMLATGCKKNDATCTATDSPAVATATEIAYLQAYCNGAYPTAVAHSSGIYYQITNPGTGAKANICSTVTVNYEGYVISSGSKFDFSTSPVSFALSRLILGWQKGIPLVKSGGSIRLFIPPSLGYGSSPVTNASGAVIIPANSYLRFEIGVVNVQ
jgi:FKBP-type peptidyl-prolyl cis-trans isomerase FkpA